MSARSRVSYPSWLVASALACLTAACATGGPPDGDAERAAATVDPVKSDGGIHKVKHVILVMQENHSFDNYFGALAYAPGSPYQPPAAGRAGCSGNDHRCV